MRKPKTTTQINDLGEELQELIVLIADAMPVVGQALEKLHEIQKLQQKMIQEKSVKEEIIE